MGLLKFFKTGITSGNGTTVGTDNPLPVVMGALDSTVDDVTVHFARGASAIPTIAAAPWTDIDTTAAKTSDAIAVPAWANAIIVQVTVSAYTASSTLSLLGSVDGANFGVTLVNSTSQTRACGSQTTFTTCFTSLAPFIKLFMSAGAQTNSIRYCFASVGG